LEFVKLTGAKTAVADVSQSRLDFCRRQMHVEHVLQASSNFENQLHEIFAGNLPDVVIDATGNPQSMSAAFGLIAHGGRLVYVRLTGEEIRFRPSSFHPREGTLLCPRNPLPADFTRIIN